MVFADQLLSMVVVTTKADSIPPWLDNLVSETGQVVSATRLANIWDQLGHEIPDALILTADDKAHLDFLQELHASPGERPALVLCINDLPDERFDSLVDLVLPQINHPLIAYQIQQAINQHQQNTRLERNLADLEHKQADHWQAIADIEALQHAIVHNVSHELGTPLLQVKSAVALIAEDITNNTLVDYALRATARLEAAVKNITQLAASVDDMQMTPLLIHENIDSALRDLRRTWEHQQHLTRINITLDKKLPPAKGDRQGITIVLQQLIDNALKFSDDRVEVSAQQVDDYIHIAVRDYGIGIDPDQLAKIFDSFYQVDLKANRKFGGTGVGLANVRLILDRHGVDIDVKSQKDKGSTFSFELPVADLKS